MVSKRVAELYLVGLSPPAPGLAATDGELRPRRQRGRRWRRATRAVAATGCRDAGGTVGGATVARRCGGAAPHAVLTPQAGNSSGRRARCGVATWADACSLPKVDNLAQYIQACS